MPGHFLAPGKLGMVLTAEARERQRGDRSGIYDVTVHDQAGTVIAEFRGHSRSIFWDTARMTHAPAPLWRSPRIGVGVTQNESWPNWEPIRAKAPCRHSDFGPWVQHAGAGQGHAPAGLSGPSLWLCCPIVQTPPDWNGRAARAFRRRPSITKPTPTAWLSKRGCTRRCSITALTWFAMPASCAC